METMPNQNDLQAVLNYLAEPEAKPVSWMYKPPEGTPITLLAHRQACGDDSKCAANSGSAIAGAAGVCSYASGQQGQKFYDDNEVRSVYYPEVQRLVKEATGAARVLVFDYNVRCGPMAKRGEPGVREPVKYAHNDYTLKSGPQRVRDLLPAGEAEELLKHRFAVINVWRPIRGPVEEMPLAVCDAQTIASKDLVPTDLKYRGSNGRGVFAGFQPGASMVFCPGHAGRRSVAAEMLRFPGRRPRAIHRSFGIRRSNHPARRRRPREHRSPHPGFLRAVGPQPAISNPKQ